MIEQSGCHLFEETKCPKSLLQLESKLTETFISVFFDGDAQQHFSSVRIHLGHEVGDNPSSAIRTANEWKCAFGLFPPAVIYRAPSAPFEDRVVDFNPSSLPVLHLYYLKSLKDGYLTLEESGAPLERLLLEFEHVLTADTQRVTLSFKSAPYPSISDERGSDLVAPTIARRVVRVQPQTTISI